MKYSLKTLITVTTLAAWILAFWRTPYYFRGNFVSFSLLALVCALFSIAMTTRKTESEVLDYESNGILDFLEPTFKLAFVLVLASALALYAVLLYGLYCFLKM